MWTMLASPTLLLSGRLPVSMHSELEVEEPASMWSQVVELVFNTLRTKVVAMVAKRRHITDAILIRRVNKFKGTLFQRSNKMLLIVCKRGPRITYYSVIMLDGRKML